MHADFHKGVEHILQETFFGGKRLFPGGRKGGILRKIVFECRVRWILGRVCDVSTLLLVKFQTVTENFFVHVVGKLHAASKLKKKKRGLFMCTFQNTWC